MTRSERDCFFFDRIADRRGTRAVLTDDFFSPPRVRGAACRRFGLFRKRKIAGIFSSWPACVAADGKESMDVSPLYLRRAGAAQYVRERWGAPCSAKWLAKLAVVGGGPQFRRIGRFPVYSRADLDEWIEAKITAPRRSTSVPA
jgi:hypothetical protein